MGGTYMSKTYCYISCLLPTFGDLCFFVADAATLIEWPFDVANIKVLAWQHVSNFMFTAP